jgi:ectoine hydroxylase-related dioxygenase (phytanoyl-CoA dioxygenase family)
VTSSFRNDPEQAMQRYRDQGYHVEEQLIPNEMRQRILQAALAHANAKDGVFAPIPMPHRVHPVFLEMMRYPPVVSIAERILGGTASGIGGEFFYMKPGTPGFSSHQDNAYVQAPPDAFISVWTALADVTQENGALIFYPGTHKLGALDTREVARAVGAGQNPGAQATECILPDMFRGMTVPLLTGSTVFFHSQLVHSSNDNRSNRFRYSFLATYLLKGQPFRAGQYQKRQEVELHETVESD